MNTQHTEYLSKLSILDNEDTTTEARIKAAEELLAECIEYFIEEFGWLEEGKAYGKALSYLVAQAEYDGA